jgi:hypothetical protein
MLPAHHSSKTSTSREFLLRSQCKPPTSQPIRSLRICVLLPSRPLVPERFVDGGCRDAARVLRPLWRRSIARSSGLQRRLARGRRCVCARSSPLQAQTRQLLACPVLYRSGAPRSMKMGTTLSPCPYDTAARHALQSASLRHPTILHYASWASRFRKVIRLPFDSGHAEHFRDRRDVPTADLSRLAGKGLFHSTPALLTTRRGP